MRIRASYAFKKLILILFCLAPLYASDGENNINFKDLSYPLEIKVKAAEPDSILYETPISETSKKQYNLVVIQGESEYLDINIGLKLISPDLKSETLINPEIFRIYRNGRFWARFKLQVPGTNSCKILFINKNKNPDFKIIVYEIQSSYEVYKQKADFQYTPNPNLSVPDTLNIIKRSYWQASDPKEPYTEHTPKAITIHHTSGKITKSLEESIAEIQFIQDYHQNAKGWIDIGYHFVVDSLGNIFEGRPIKVVGAHVYLKNTNNIGISLMGNYHPPKNDIPSEKAIKAISSIAYYVSQTYSVEKSSFYAHRDLGATDCPGDILYSKMPQLKKEIFEKQDMEISITDYNYPKTKPELFLQEVFKKD
ncbi:MAG: hypothetical protein GX447_04485 [Elusimicrobia bacterium]|nr:hypothetical protein [Elusimicrobiota bacterium]